MTLYQFDSACKPIGSVVVVFCFVFLLDGGGVRVGALGSVPPAFLTFIMVSVTVFLFEISGIILQNSHFSQLLPPFVSILLFSHI